LTAPDDKNPFTSLKYEDFQRLAQQPGLSPHNQIGFPDAYRESYEEAIFLDIAHKLPRLMGPSGTVIDIGPGLGPLAEKIAATCSDQAHRLVLVDSPEMLSHSPDGDLIRKVPGQFPQNADGVNQAAPDGADVVIIYSVLHYIFPETTVDRFLAATAGLLRPGGAMLIGDIPNFSKRRRFFCSAAGLQFHRAFTGRDEDPDDAVIGEAEGQITDTVLLQMLAGFRDQGYDAYILPQADDLPMANRREDILIKRP
jgi:2-polyprenyl-3-methyl-5-hydroxy-6-metoxy-1,4-benzoquinol methylase